MGLFSKSDIENTAEKHSVSYEESKESKMGLSAQDTAFLANFPEDKRRRALRKIDWRLIPLLVVLYLITYIDKTNIGNAKIEGLLEDLHMDGTQYNVALSIFFIPYVIAEVPSNMIMNKFKRPSLYLGTLIVIWGIIMTLTGVVQNFGGLTTIRFFLGLFEAGFFPGAILLISKWYMPNETQARIALLYTSAATGGAFSGLLAFAIAKMDGIGGLGGWRWIFILEGIITVATGVICVFCLADSPSTSGWLNAEEIRFLELRQVQRNFQLQNQPRQSNLTILREVICDWKMCLLILINLSNAVPNYALKFTMPQIIKNMGFTSARAQLLTIPPYFCGAFGAYIFSHFADRYTWRMPFIVTPQSCLIVAFAILFSKSGDIKDNIALCYFAVCLSCFGMYPIFPGVNAWNISNIVSPAKRAISIGYLVCMGNAGGLVGSYIYIDKEKPRYPTGYGASFGFAASGLISCLLLEYSLWKINAKRDAISEDEVRAKYTDDELVLMAEKSPLFRYTL